MEENKKTTKEAIEEKEEKVVEVVDVVTEDSKKQEQPIDDLYTKSEKKDSSDSKGLSIASMVLGIVSLCLIGEGLVSTVCGVLAIVFGIKGQKRANPKMAKAGFIMGIVSLSLKALLIVLGIMLFVGLLFSSII